MHIPPTEGALNPIVNPPDTPVLLHTFLKKSFPLKTPSHTLGISRDLPCPPGVWIFLWTIHFITEQGTLCALNGPRSFVLKGIVALGAFNKT